MCIFNKYPRLGVCTWGLCPYDCRNCREIGGGEGCWSDVSQVLMGGGGGIHITVHVDVIIPTLLLGFPLFLQARGRRRMQIPIREVRPLAVEIGLHGK